MLRLFMAKARGRKIEIEHFFFAIVITTMGTFNQANLKKSVVCTLNVTGKTLRVTCDIGLCKESVTKNLMWFIL